MLIIGNDGDNTLHGSAFADFIFSLGGDDDVFGGDGNDTLFGDEGRDRLDGGAGVDTVDYSTFRTDVLIRLDIGIAANGDQLFSIENAVGSRFDDVIRGSADDNRLAGGDGDDSLQGLGGADTLDGGNGQDRAVYTLSDSGVIVDLRVGAGLGGDADGDTLISIEHVTGSNFADVLIGDDGFNSLVGLRGADRLMGGRGADGMVGGDDADVFSWRDVTESGTSIAAMDKITDFDPLEGDRIDLNRVDADATVPGNQAFTFIGAAAFSGTPGEINFVHVGNETIIQLQTDGGGGIEMGIRLAGIVTPEASWFIL
jgi:Ca2+-binding RTX toxin-like protein